MNSLISSAPVAAAGDCSWSLAPYIDPDRLCFLLGHGGIVVFLDKSQASLYCKYHYAPIKACYKGSSSNCRLTSLCRCRLDTKMIQNAILSTTKPGFLIVQKQC